MNKKVVTLALLIGMGSLAQAGTFVATENEKYGTDELHKIALSTNLNDLRPDFNTKT